MMWWPVVRRTTSVPAPGQPAFARDVTDCSGAPTRHFPNHGRPGPRSGRKKSEPPCHLNSGAHGTTEVHACCPTTRAPGWWRRPTDLAQTRCRLTPPKPRTSSTAGRTCRRSEKETPPSGRGQPGTKAGAPHAAPPPHGGPSPWQTQSRASKGEDQQHGGSPEHQTTLRQMQPEPSPAVPRPDVPKGHGEALGPTGRMLQYHQDQPAAPLCQMLRRGGGQSVCSGDAAHGLPIAAGGATAARRTLGNERRARQEHGHRRAQGQYAATLRGSRQSGHTDRAGAFGTD